MNRSPCELIDNAPPVCVPEYATDGLPFLSSFTTAAAVVLRQQQAAVIGADDAVAVVAGLLPDERPFPRPRQSRQGWR